MRLTRNSEMRLSLINATTTITLLTILGLCAWLSTRYHWQLDWTASGRNTLSEASQRVLETMPDAVAITVYAREDRIEGRVIAELLRRYVHVKPDIAIEFVNPDLNPERLRALGVTRVGTLQIRYQERERVIAQPSERTISNVLLQLAKPEARIVAYLTGHGERSLAGQANHDLGTFGAQLAGKGFTLVALNLASAGTVPENTDVLLVAGPLVDLLDAELSALSVFVGNGGNLLWLRDPGSDNRLAILSKLTGVTLVPGTLIDPATSAFKQVGLANPTYTLVAQYARHAALDGFELLSVLPGAAGLIVASPDGEGWTATTLFKSSEKVWSETGPLRGTIRFDSQTERRGPYDLAVALTRQVGERAQRIVVVGDGDFLSNSALGNSGNLDLGIRLFTWLAADDALLNIPARSDPDSTLTLTTTETAVIGLGSLLGLPLLLTGTGVAIWLRRRHR